MRSITTIVTPSAVEKAPMGFRDMLNATSYASNRNTALNSLDHFARLYATVFQYGNLDDRVLHEDEPFGFKEDCEVVKTFIRVFREYAIKRMDEMRIFLKAA